MCGLFLVLRSGSEHLQLRHKPCQIELVENTGEKLYLVYREDISKNNPGGLKGWDYKRKVVTPYENTENSDRCTF